MSFSSDIDDGYTNSITGVAISNQSILILCTLGFGTLGLVLFIILRHLSTDQENENEQSYVRGYDDVLDDSDVATLNRAQRRARAKFRMKKARRAPTPNVGAQVGEGDENVLGGENNQVGRDDNDGIVAVDANRSRKERQRAAKAKEREERKVYSEKARVLREKKQSTKTKSEDKNVCDDTEINNSSVLDANDVLSVEDIFPRMANVEDALSEYLFWESIMKNLKQTTNPNDEIISIAQSIPKMTIHGFVERLKHDGSVSIASLANEFGITIPQALDELERINKQHGVIGVADSKGNFVYVSMKMIQDAIKIGQYAGRIPFPTS